MEWISIKDKMPPIDEGDVLCWSVKFGDEKRSSSSHPVILWWNGTTWQDDNDRDYENNPDYHLITHWAFIKSPSDGEKV